METKNTGWSASALLRAAHQYEDDSPPTPAPRYYLPGVSVLKSSLQNSIQKPIKNYAHEVYSDTERLAYDTGKTLCTWIIRMFAFLFALAATVSIAFSMYCMLYWFVIPTKEYSWRLHFDYGTPPPVTTTVSTHSSGELMSVAYGTESMAAPLASVNILDDHREQWNVTDIATDAKATSPIGDRLLSKGLGYTVTVRLILPESPTNMHRPIGGAAMLNVELLDHDHAILARSNRPVLMRWKSFPVRLARWAALTPMYLLGIMQESQTHTFVLFESYVESAKHPLAHVRVWLSDPTMQVSSADVFVIAELKGLAYWMYHWFFMSATVGTFCMWMCVVLTSVLLWSCCCVQCTEDNSVEDKRGRSDGYIRDEDGGGDGGRRREQRSVPLNEDDWRGREYIPTEERGVKED